MRPFIGTASCSTILEMSSSSTSPPRRSRQGSTNAATSTTKTLRNGGSSSSSSSNKSSGGKSSGSKSSGEAGAGGGAGGGGRNRGANAANHNRRGHLLRTSSKDDTPGERRSSSSSSSSSSSDGKRVNTKRPPRWEREGDRLYAEVTKDLNAILALEGSIGDDANDDDDVDSGGGGVGMRVKPTSAQDVCRLLEPWTAALGAADNANAANKDVEDDDDDDDDAVVVHDTGHGSSSRRGGLNNEITMEESDKGQGNDETGGNNIDKAHSTSPPPFLWGSLPVGPVLASRLYATGRSEPTSVQRAAFPILTATVSDNNNGNNNSFLGGNNGDGSRSRRMGGYATSATTNTTAKRPNIKKKKTIKRTNAIIASPTGTGKTLAYLLPLLCTSPGGQRGEGAGGILIVTPTIELACQIQREVDVLWPPLPPSVSSSSLPLSFSSSSLFVVGDGSIASDVVRMDGTTAMSGA